MKRHHFTLLSAAIAASLLACSAQDNDEGTAVYAEDTANNARGSSTGGGTGYDNGSAQTSAEAGEAFDQSASGGAVGQPSDPNGAPPEEAYAGEGDFDDGAFDTEESEPTEEEASPAEIQWIQLSTDDSTSMASAQLFKSRESIYGFSLKAHEFLNYYDPPRSLFAEEAFTRTKPIDDSLRFGVKAVHTELEVSTATPEDPIDDESDAESERPTEQDDSDIVTEEEPVEPVAEPIAIAGELEVLFQLQADPIAREARRNWNLFLCVDVSGSMEGQKMAFTKDALRKILDHLKDGDQVTLTTFNNDARTIFESLTYPADRDEMVGAFNQLVADGGTNMLAGLNESYDIAQQNHRSDATNRVLLFGDGAANVGTTDMEAFSRLTRINGQEGIYLSGIGVGTGYEFELMDQLTDAGKGAHVFLPNAEEVDLIFGDYLPKLIEVAADKIAVEATLPEGLQLSGFSGEEVSFDPNQRLQNIILATGDDMTFTAKFDVLDEAALDQPMTLKVTLRPLSSGEVTMRKIEVESIRELIGEPGRLFERTRLIHRFGQWATGRTGSVEALLDDLSNYENPDWGIQEIINLIR